MAGKDDALGLLDDLLRSFEDMGSQAEEAAGIMRAAPEPPPASIRAQSEEGQKHLDLILERSDKADLTQDAIDQEYGETLFHHVGEPGLVSYDLGAGRKANENAPVGMWTYPEKKESDKYLENRLKDNPDVPAGQTSVVTAGKQAFVVGADKPTEAMVADYLRAIEKNFGFKYDEIPDHKKAYVDGKLDRFKAWGIPEYGLISGEEISKIYTDNGMDILVNGREVVHLKPEQLRKPDAMFDPMMKGENDLNAFQGKSKGPDVVGGLMDAGNKLTTLLDDDDPSSEESNEEPVDDQSMTDPEWFDTTEEYGDMTPEEYLVEVLDIATDFTPIIGEAKSLDAAIDSYNEGDTAGTIINGLGAIPGVSYLTKGGKAVMGMSDEIADVVTKVVDEFSEVGSKVAKAAPKKTQKAYKLFRTKPDSDELYPLFVNANEGVPTGKWVDAEVGPLTDKGKVKSKIGELAYRPGWHSGDYIAATHIGGKATKGAKKPEYRPANQVWAEVEVPDDVDWQSVADSRASIVKSGPNKGKLNAKEAHITDQVPEGGHYRYKTNPNMQGNWIISGSMKVNKKLSPEEMAKVQKDTDIYDLPTLPEFIDKNGLSLNDLNNEAVKELKTNYPEKFSEMAEGVEGFNQGGLMSEADNQNSYQRGGEVKKLNCGGMLEVISMGGLMGDDMIVGHDPVSGNPIPPGSNAENVRDDIPAVLSDGEYVVPADVVRYHGLKTFMDLRMEAKMGLMAMHDEGQIVEVETEDYEEDEDIHVTPEGNKVEKAKVETEEETLEEDDEEVEAAEGGDVRKGYLQKERAAQAAADAAVDEMAIENGATPTPPGVGLASPEEDGEIEDDYVDTNAQAAADAAADEMAAENAIVEKVIKDANGNEVTVLYDLINDEIIDPDDL